MPPAVAPELFRPDCLRGPARQTLSPASCEQIGQALGSQARARGFGKMVVGRDGRLLSQDHAGRLMAGLNDSGIDVIDLGLVPIGVLQHAAQALADGCGVMVTAGRSPAAWGGFKPMLGGTPLGSAALQDLARRIEAQDHLKGAGEFERDSHTERYLDHLVADLQVQRPLKVVLDHGNGATAVLGADLFKRLGCTVHEIWPQVDGNFPNHFPDPTLSTSLVDAVSVQRSSQQGSAAFVFGCDGASLAMVDTRGYLVEPDRVLMLLAGDLLARHPGATVVADARVSPRVQTFVEAAGGRLVMAPVGQGAVHAALLAHGALLAGDLTGHYWFADRGGPGLDDALYAAGRITEVLAAASDPAALLAALPRAQAPSEWRLKAEAGTAEALVAAMAAVASDGWPAPLAPADLPQVEPVPGFDHGLRLRWPAGLCVIRASTTTHGLAVRCEGQDAASLERAQATFKALLAAVHPGVSLPF